MADAFYGEIRVFAFGFTPENWLLCNGQTLYIQQDQVLYTVLGKQYGGDGQTTFKVPNLMGSTVAGSGPGPGLTARTVGQQWGASFNALSLTQLPNHQHAFNAVTAGQAYLANEPTANAHLARTLNQYDFSSAATPNTTMAPSMIVTAGGGQPHENRQPYLSMNFCICRYGEYPVKAS